VTGCLELWRLRSAISTETKAYEGYRHWLEERENIFDGGEGRLLRWGVWKGRVISIGVGRA